MAISFGSSANNFTTFLDTVNNASTPDPKYSFDVETAAKQALGTMASRPSHEDGIYDKDLRDKLGISDEQLVRVIGHLEKEEMILPRSETGHKIVLSSFAVEAVKVFNVF